MGENWPLFVSHIKVYFPPLSLKIKNKTKQNIKKTHTYSWVKIQINHKMEKYGILISIMLKISICEMKVISEGDDYWLLNIFSFL